MSDEKTVNMIAFPGVTFTQEQMAAVSQMATRLFDAEAQVAELRAQVATLTERLSRCTCTDDYGDVAE